MKINLQPQEIRYRFVVNRYTDSKTRKWFEKVQRHLEQKKPIEIDGRKVFVHRIETEECDSTPAMLVTIFVAKDIK